MGSQKLGKTQHENEDKQVGILLVRGGSLLDYFGSQKAFKNQQFTHTENPSDCITKSPNEIHKCAE